MEKAQEILWHIEELYSEAPSRFKVEQMCQSNPVRYQAWVDAFKDYDLSDVLQAIDNFWEFKNSKTKPNVAQIKATLEQHKVDKLAQTPAEPEATDCDGYALMAADLARGDCRHNFPMYKAAVDLICNDWLVQEIPASEWGKMSKAARYRQASINGLLGRINEALVIVCRKITGKDYEFLSENEKRVSGVERGCSSRIRRG